jgi:hypothetical protein
VDLLKQATSQVEHTDAGVLEQGEHLEQHIAAWGQQAKRADQLTVVEGCCGCFLLIGIFLQPMSPVGSAKMTQSNSHHAMQQLPFEALSALALAAVEP